MGGNKVKPEQASKVRTRMRRLRVNLKCLNQHTAIAALAHGT